jgi:RRXRR protein
MVPVVDSENKPLMPCTERRARKMVEAAKATPFWSFGIWCVRLNIEPSARNTQEIACGIDPGSKREGFTVKSKNKTFVNIQTKAVDWVKDKVESRRNLRKSRRNRKTPCRQPRFSNRPGCRLAPSTKARWQLKLRILNRLMRLLPIQYVVIEDVEAATNRGKIKAKSFQMVMQGKNWIYEQIKKLDVVLMTAKGYETFEKRNTLGLKKLTDKMSTNFHAHCVDSWVLASMAVGGTEVENKRMHIVKPMQKNYRNLHVQNFARGGVRRNQGSTRSMGFERGSIVRHPKYGVCTIGGTRKERVSLHSLSDGRRMCQNAKPEDIVFKTFNSFTLTKGAANSSPAGVSFAEDL